MSEWHLFAITYVIPICEISFAAEKAQNMFVACFLTIPCGNGIMRSLKLNIFLTWELFHHNNILLCRSKKSEDDKNKHEENIMSLASQHMVNNYSCSVLVHNLEYIHPSQLCSLSE